MITINTLCLLAIQCMSQTFLITLKTLHMLSSVCAIFPYAATASDELNLTPGDVISVHVKNPDGWYEGTLNGVRGLFPGNYVESAE